MKTFLVSGALAAAVLFNSQAFAQEGEPAAEMPAAETSPPADEGNPYEGENLRVLVDQYATATLGFLIEDRCHQMEDGARQQFTDDFLVVDEFIGELIGAGPREGIVMEMAASADNVDLNPCNTDTFRFGLTTATLTAQLATRIRILKGDGMVVTPPDSETPVAAATAKTENPKEKKASPPPVSATPVSLPPSSAPAGETKKEMIRRHRDEIIALRKKHQDEMDRFKDNEDAYDDPKEARRLLEERQEQEQDALKERQKQEEDSLDERSK